MGENRLNTKKFLSIVSFRNLLNWSVPYLTGSKIEFTTAYPMVRIGDFLSKNKTPITIEDEKEYVRVRIKTHNGGVERREKNNVLGKSIGTKKQYVISEGQFIISKIDARNGAMGIVPKDLDGAIVTQDFLPYDIDTNIINPQYLVLVSTTKPFVEFCQRCSSGTTNRQRINEDEFLNIKIPVPKLKEQDTIISKFADDMHTANQKEDMILNGRQQLDSYLLNVLGVKNAGSKDDENNSNYRFLRIVHLKDISRWDLYYKKTSSYSELYDNVVLSDVTISKPQYGAAFSSKPYDGDIRYIRITDINEDGTLNDNIVSASSFSERFTLKENDFLIARSGNTVGKTFLYKEELGKAIYAGYLIRFELDTYRIIPEYLLAYTKCSLYKNWVKKNMRVSAQPNINSQQFLGSPIILPPLIIQKEVVKHVNEQLELAKQLKSEAKVIQEKAIKEFENKIFETV